MKPVRFSDHALQQLLLRGATKEEVVAAIQEGEVLPAQSGRIAFRRNFPFGATWKGKRYDVKQVQPIVVEEDRGLVVVTVYVFFFGA